MDLYFNTTMSFCDCAGEDKQFAARRNFVGVDFFFSNGIKDIKILQC